LWQLFKLRSFIMRSINPFKLGRSPLRNPQSRNASSLSPSYRLSITGDAQ
jgi:hypothetical protein